MNSVSLQRLLQFFSFRMHTWHTINGESILEISVRLLGVVFADVVERKFVTQVISTVFRVSSLIVTGLFVANFFFAHDIGEFAKIFEGAMVGLQTSNDQIFGLAYKNEKLKELVQKKKYFWLPKVIDPRDKCGSRRIQVTTLVFGNMFGMVLFSCLVCYIAAFIIFGTLDLWTPKSHPHLGLAIMIYSLSWGSFACISTFVCNLLIVAFCVEVAIQFRLINFRLGQMGSKWNGINVNKGVVVKEIREIIRHHSFILDYWQGVREVFSVLMFVRIFETMGTLCMGLFILSAEDSSLYNLSRSFILTGCLMMQMVLMVFSAEIVNEESSNVFNEAYASPWNTHSELSSYVKILMVRAMAPCTLTAGGIIEINKPMMTSVIKTTFSYFTAIRTVAATNELSRQKP